MKKLFETPNLELLCLESNNAVRTDDVLWTSIPGVKDPNELGEY